MRLMRRDLREDLLNDVPCLSDFRIEVERGGRDECRTPARRSAVLTVGVDG